MVLGPDAAQAQELLLRQAQRPAQRLQVIVDQTAPTLQIQLRELTPGEVELTWSAADDHLNVDSLRLEFLDANTQNWQPVGISPADSGRTSWTVAQGGSAYTPNVAARLQTLAEPGQVIIGERTFLAVRDDVVADPLGGLGVRGRLRPVRAYVVRENV